MDFKNFIKGFRNILQEKKYLKLLVYILLFLPFTMMHNAHYNKSPIKGFLWRILIFIIFCLLCNFLGLFLNLT